MGERLRPVRALAGAGFEADPLRAAGVALLALAEYGGGAFIPLILRQVTDAAVAGSTSRAVTLSIVLALAVVASQLCGFVAFVLRTGLRERVSLLFDRRLMQLSGGIPGIEHLERPEYLDELALLRAEHDALADVQAHGVVAAGMSAQLLISVILLAGVDRRFAVLPLLALPSVWASFTAERQRQRTRQRLAGATRLESALHRLAVTPAAAREARVFRVEEELARRCGAIRSGINAATDRSQRRATVLEVAGWLPMGAGFMLAVAWLATAVSDGRHPLGDLVLALALMTRLNGQVSGLVGTGRFLQRSAKTARRYLWLVDHAASITPQGVSVPTPRRLVDGISLEGVEFRYPGTERAVLHGLDLFLPAGATVALVGENGAGKSTLVKLLCGFYRPTRGRIAIDGVDLGDLGPEAWRASLSAAFQDFCRFEFTVGVAVGIGDLDRREDTDAVRAALTRGGAQDLVESFASGLDTQLGTSFQAGRDLSGGEWQKIALARSLMQPAPLLLVLDEPTSGLDAMAEQALFERFGAAAAGARRSAGAVTVVVSHRFTTVRQADHIVVVGDGGIREQGTHEQLMTLGGTYAELYSLQASAYR